MRYFILFLLSIFPFAVIAENFLTTTISRSLVKMGMEDVVVKEDEGIFRIFFDDNIYRGPARGTFEIIRMLIENPEIKNEIHLIIQENRISQIVITLPAASILGYHESNLSLHDVMSSVKVSYDTDREDSYLKDTKRANTSAGKMDLIFYPQITLRNSWFDKLYGYAFNIAPALEVNLWKGAFFTGQVIFPVLNNMDGEVDYIRAGFLTFRQEYRFSHNVFTSLAVGNFNMNRMGVDANVSYRPNNDRWMVNLNGGLTGSSTFYGGSWSVSPWKRFTGSVSFRYNEPVYGLQFDITAQRHVYGDYGARFDCSRHFGEVSIGFYAMHTGGEPNGGFNFTVPLPQKKRTNRRLIRIGIPEYFDWEYEAQSGNEYTAKRLGHYYEIRPDENRSQRYYNPDYIKKSLMQLADDAKD